MYKLEHLNPTKAQGLPLYPVRLVPNCIIILKKSYIDSYQEEHNINIHAKGLHLYFNSEQDAVFFMLKHNS